MKIKRVTSLIMITILLVVSLVGCKNESNTETVVDIDADYDGIVTAEKNYFDMTRTDLDKVINAIADFEVCSRVQMKLLNNEDMYSKEIVEDMYDSKVLQQIEAFCDCPENEQCEHRIQAEEFNKNLTPVREFDQTQMETWYGGPVALSEMKLNLVTYNVFHVSEEEILVSLKYRDENMEVQNIIGKYNNSKKLITEIR